MQSNRISTSQSSKQQQQQDSNNSSSSNAFMSNNPSNANTSAQAAAFHNAPAAASNNSSPSAAAPNLSALTTGSPLAFAEDGVNSQQWQMNTRFSYSQAIVWQIKFIIQTYLTKKTAQSASAELSQLSDKFGTDFDKYLIRELVEQIDLKDPNKVSKDKNEAVKSQLLAQELSRMCLKPDFLKYFDEIAQGVYGDRYADFISELSRRLKLSTKMQLMIALSLAESCPEASKSDCYTILKQKLVEYQQGNRQESLEDYAVHRLSYILSVYPEFQDDNADGDQPAGFFNAVQQFRSQATKKQQSASLSLRVNFCSDGDLLSQNPSPDDPSYSLIRVGSDFDSLMRVSKFMEPWEVLQDLGYYNTFDYQLLTMVLQDFKDISERTMANTILQLALKNSGEEGVQTRIAHNVFKANKTGDPLKKDSMDKSQTLQWQADPNHYSRAFRENYSNLNWLKVFESFSELDEEIDVGISLDQKAYETLIQIFNKSKPSNLQISSALLLEKEWTSPQLQFAFLSNAIRCYISSEDRSFPLTRSNRKVSIMQEIPVGPDVIPAFVDIWGVPEILEVLFKLSDKGLYQEVRNLMEEPLQKAPEYLLLAISKCNIDGGNLLLDDILSNLLPIFLTNQQSNTVLKKLWEFNQNLMIRAICECCRHEQRILNLSRVLDITQEIKDSLIKIVYCNDYDFAVNLGVLAGKREFLHYDVWLKERIKKVGTPFVKAFIKYINEQIIIPCKDFMISNGYATKQLTQEDIEVIDHARDAILERSHLSKERLCMTMEHLENPANFQSLVQNPAQFEMANYFPPEAHNVLTKISLETQNQIKDLVAQYAILFPRQVGPTQSTEEIDKAANEYFQHIFSAEPHQVDERIQELIVTLQTFQKSQVVKEQEIYACVLHGLFDEYRFLHKYPHVYLTKIAKLFGAIIKNRLLNNVLQGIALKFVIEAFRRDGKRLMFGIIVVKEFLECLPEFPKQFQEIYANRDKIQQKDPELYQRIEVLFKQTIGSMEPETDANSSHDEQYNDSSNTSAISFSDVDEGKGAAALGADTEMFPNFDPAKGNKDDPKQNQNAKNQQKNNDSQQDGAPGSAQAQANLFKQMGTNSSTFVPSNKGNQNLKVNSNQQKGRKISPNVQAQNFGQQPTATLSNVNKGPQAEQRKTQMSAGPVQPANRPDSFDAQNPLGSNLSVTSAAFKRNDGSIGPATISEEQKRRAQQQTVQQNNMQNQQIPKAVVAPLPQVYIQQKAQQALQTQQQQQAALTAQQQMMHMNRMPINLNAKSFVPNEFNPNMMSGLQQMLQPQYVPNPQHIAWQKLIDSKIEEAKTNKQHRLRFEDLIEDLELEQPSQNVIDQIKLKCNNTGKNNFKQNLEAIKDLVITKADEQRKTAIANGTQTEPEEGDERPEQKDINLNWFLNYILTKRISGQNQTLYHIYIELIRNIGHPDAISLTILIACQIFQRCLLIDEVEFNKVANKVGGTSGMISQIKQYLKTLGQFLGQLTLARNRPIKNKELDIKQMLVHGFQHDQRRLVISFACNIIKECTKSVVFKIQNPWLNGILQVLREMIDCLQMPHMKNLKEKEEIESELVFLFKSFNIQNINEIIPSGVLKASQGSQIMSVSQDIELSFLNSKPAIIPIRQKSASQGRQAPNGPDGQDKMEKSTIELMWDNFSQNLQGMNEERLDNFKFIFMNISIQEENRAFLKEKFCHDDQAINEFLTKAVEQSIEEILKPVVDRSVTIALITTKELVKKDFANDIDADRISEASEHIIQSLAGSLALVTCREPLRLQMNNYLREALKETCLNAGSTTGLRRAQIHEGMPLEEQERQAKQEQFLNYYLQDHEEKLLEIAQETSKENLELGCKMIKNAVITKAHVQVKEDRVINEALMARRKAQEAGEKTFKDTSQMSMVVNELPAALRPNPNGLTEDQFKVYKDFSKLSYKSKFDQVPMGGCLNQYEMEPQVSSMMQGGQKQKPPAQYEFTIDSLIRRLMNEKPIDSVTRSLLTIKMSHLNKQGPEASEDIAALWKYCDSQFQNIVQCCDNRQWQQAKSIGEKVKLIVQGMQSEQFGSKLLREAYMEMEEMYILDAEITVLFLSCKIFPVNEWDEAITKYIESSSGQLQSKAFEFLSEVVKRCLYSQKLFTHEMIPCIVELLKKVTSQTDQQSAMLSFQVGDVFEQLKGQIPTEFESKLRMYFKKWVELSQIDDPVAQEREINYFFERLTQVGIAKDEELLFVFCKIMVKESIELAQHSKNGMRRLNNNTLDYRFIDSFIKLVICLLTTSELNKMQFMSKIFEFVRQKLDDDHFSQQKVFNQKPYYRMLMNILRAVTMSECFYAKMQRKILFDLADLLKDLNPNNYPAFAFAWLALVSNQLFMPNFIKTTTNFANMNQKMLQQELESASTKKGETKQQNAQQSAHRYELENQLQRLYKMKDLLVSCFSFLKTNFLPGQQASPAMRSFYTATMNVVLIILKDYPQFLCDFHFNFVNALPDHAIQLKNLILTAFPKSVSPPSPFSQGLKVDPLQGQQHPRILSNFVDYIKLNGLKDHINDYFVTNNQIIINDICLKMMSCQVKINGNVVPQSSVINAVVLYIATCVCDDSARQNENAQAIELFKQIAVMLNDETRLCFLNSIVNELRYPSSHTLFFCMVVLRLFAESKAMIQEQISTIFFERLQTLKPYPWGLMINFRELIQNQKYGFTKSAFIIQNQEAVKNLIANKERLRNYLQFMPVGRHPGMANLNPTISGVGYPTNQGAQMPNQNMQMPQFQQPGHPQQFMRQPSGQGSFEQSLVGGPFSVQRAASSGQPGDKPQF